jgi:hypothetical protein
MEMYSQGYGGPSLLSRGGNTPGRRGRAPMDFNIYAAVRGTYDTGMIAPVIDESGNVNSVATQGLQAEIGAYGAKAWRRSSLGMDYRGDYRRYTTSSGFNGTNQALSLDFMHQFSRRLSVFARQTGGTTNRAFGGFSAPAFISPGQFGVPLNEIYDSRVYFAQTSAGASYQTSARTNYFVEAAGFLVKRTDPALIGMQGYSGGGGVQHRLTRSDTIGVSADYIHFEYPRIYGETDAQSLSIDYSRMLTRNIDLRISGGAFRATTVGTQAVELSPEVALILGRSSGVAAFSRTVISPQVDVGVGYTMERGRLQAGYTRGIGAGNGIYITTERESLDAGYSYSGIRRMSIGVSAAYTRAKSVGLTLGDYSSIQGGGGVSYRLSEYLDLSAQADRRRFRAPGIPGRSGTFLSIGLAFSPSRFPLAIW